jgi:hypothetical protein
MDNQYGNAGYSYGQQAPQQPAQQSGGVPLGWDDEVEEKSFILLPEGEYQFRVKEFTREQFNGSEKMPPCNCANITLAIDYNGDEVLVNKKLYLLSTNGQLFAFFRSIGSPLLPNGNVRMNWQTVPGATGSVLISHRKYNNNEYNNVKQFIIPTAQPQPATPAYNNSYSNKTSW